LAAPVIPYSFYGGNREALLCREPGVILSGAAETGKTVALLFKLHTLAYKYPGCQLAIVRKRKTDIVGTAYNTLKRDLLTNYGPGTRVYGGQYPQWIDYPGGSRIWMGGMDDPGKTLSAERDVIYVNQVEELSLSDWEYLTRCTTGRGAVMPYTQVIADCNPAGPTHWIKTQARAGKFRLFVSTHQDNPTLWDHTRGEWTEQGRRSLAILGNMTGARRLRLFLGLWAAPEGAIYDVFDGIGADGQYGRHVVRGFSPPNLWPRVVGVDPLGAFTAAVWGAFDPQTGMLHVYREYYEPFGATTPGHVRAILERSKGETVFGWAGGGPSENQARLDWADAGIPLLEPPAIGVWEGIDRVYQLLKDFALVIHDSCPMLLGELEDYKRKLVNGVPTEAIENKEAYHLADALRYLVAWLTGEEVGEEVVYRPVQLGPRY
jgi:hypothetical protein